MEPEPTKHVETTLYKGSPSLVLQIWPLLLCALIMIGSAVAAALFVNVWFLIAGAIAAVVGLERVVVVKSRVYELTTERIRVTKGIASKRTDELELYRVKDATLFEPFLLRMFSLGNIQITTNDASTPSLTIEAISGARELREQLRQSIEECRDHKKVRMTELE